MTRVTYKSALRAKGVRPLLANWCRPVPKPGDRILVRTDRPVIVA